MIYIVSLDYFPDINECESSPCHNSIDCTNTPGSYVCNCSSGYQGNGTRCQGKKPFYFHQYVIYKPRFLYALGTFQLLTITTYPSSIRQTSTPPTILTLNEHYLSRYYTAIQKSDDAHKFNQPFLDREP